LKCRLKEKEEEEEEEEEEECDNRGSLGWLFE
jgi:ribosomal protein L12E/L44/L45/RPP1/RPP2